MLVITRRLGQAVRIGDVLVKVVRLETGRVALGIEAPLEVGILAEERVGTAEPPVRTERGA